MSTETLSQEEATRLLEMIKHALINHVNIPPQGEKVEFNVQGTSNSDVFVICIFRGKIRHDKCNWGARIKKNGIVLLELHVAPSARHQNPDGSLIIGSHWHVYTENDGTRIAFSATDIESDDFVSNTLTFLQKFNVITVPSISHQLEL